MLQVFLTSRAYFTMLLTLLCLPPSTLLDFIAWSFYKTTYAAQLLYITSSLKFGRHYEVEVLISVTIFRRALPFKCKNYICLRFYYTSVGTLVAIFL